MLTDSPALRALLANLLPGINITATPRASGQRVVFFCKFDPKAVGKTEPLKRATWGAVVLKASEGIHPSQIAYLEKEIEILNSLNSQHYPKLHWNETFTHDPISGDALPYRLFVTIEERIPSEPLSAVMAAFRDQKTVTTLLLGLVDSLKPLWEHPARLVHRDIKPDNILIRPNGSVAIIDLGIVREEGSAGVTATGSPFGPCTALYASPEQARNDKRNISFKSDFFSIGVMAYELIAGANPFGTSHDPPLDVLEKVQNFQPESLAKRAGTSQSFSDLIEKLMEKHPYRRYRTVPQLEAEIRKQLIP